MNKKEVLTSNGKRIVICDDLFSLSERQLMYSFCKNSYYKLQGKDTDIIELQNNISMISIFTMKDVKSMGFQSFIKDREILDVFNNYQFESALVNLSTPADMHNVHTDAHGIPGITMLYYVNMRWSIEWAGETVFLNETMTDFEFVSPYKPGRLVMFDGSIPHVIRPPIMKADTLRMTFALRFIKEHNE